jgi:hypothetical protein
MRDDLIAWAALAAELWLKADDANPKSIGWGPGADTAVEVVNSSVLSPMARLTVEERAVAVRVVTQSRRGR